MDVVRLPFETDAGFGDRARIGLVVLETDQTIEAEARMLGLAGVDFYHSRIANDPEVTPETLSDMEQLLPVAAGLLPRQFDFDAVGYGCTSAATMIGEDRVAAALNHGHPDVPTSNPITAAIAAFRALGVGRIAIVTPYTVEVTTPVVDLFSDAGFTVPAVASFLESNDLVVARISEESVAAAVRTIAGEHECDAVFVSCTSLRTMGIIDGLEQEIGVPVVSSNVALFWHLLRQAGVDDPIPGRGRLLATPMPT